MNRPLRSSAVFGGQGRPVRPAAAGPVPTSIGALLFQQSRDLDELMAALEHPFNSPLVFDALEARANAIADGIRAAFRGRRRPGEAL